MELVKVEMQYTALVGKNKFVSSDYEVLAKNYEELEEVVEDVKAKALYLMKKNVKHGDWNKLCDTIGITIQSANQHVKRFEDKLTIESQTETRVSIPESTAQHRELRGATPNERQENFEAAQEAVGKKQPSSRDIKTFNKPKEKWEYEKEFRNEFRSDNQESFAEYEEASSFTAKAEFGLDDFEPEEVLHELYPTWKTSYRKMSKVFHEDTGSVKCNECMNIISRINDIMKHFEKFDKQNTIISDYMSMEKAYIVTKLKEKHE